MKLGIISDIHFNGDMNIRGKLRRDLLACIGFWERNGADFVIQLGDLIDGEGAQAKENLAEALAIFRTASLPVLHVPGNHCLAVPLKEYLCRARLCSPYYAFRHAGVRFIVLHGMDINPASRPTLEADRQRQDLAGRDRWANGYCGAIGQNQLRWLERQLDSASESAEPVVLFCHFPLLKETTDEAHGLLWNHEEVTGLLCRRCNILACFNGHYHHSAHALRSGIHYISLPAFRNRLEPPFRTCGMIEIGKSQLRVTDMNTDLLHELTIP
ncbi:hypothetical protein CHL67_01030 [Prosthecochloris sp. GSB1]|uniref:metallophosphoesterase n=1 Tax=Prosthecochloris sp. GSB1 TaxID=281093 RepID=UPI000B8CAD30|nr:metallophosphoesterase [Prosthecochloris sp. GSB1]ASQ89691.1 hypothetical protein CHL67_01030 [Prosthecochloris sp. GSB1]